MSGHEDTLDDLLEPQSPSPVKPKQTKTKSQRESGLTPNAKRNKKGKKKKVKSHSPGNRIVIADDVGEDDTPYNPPCKTEVFNLFLFIL